MLFFRKFLDLQQNWAEDTGISGFPVHPHLPSFFLAAPCGFQDLSSLTRNQTQAPAVEAQSPNHLTTRGFPPLPLLYIVFPIIDISHYGGILVTTDRKSVV